MSPLIQIADTFGAKVISYVDDSQLLFSWNKGSEANCGHVKSCLTAVFYWLAKAQLKCNQEKTKILLFWNFPLKFWLSVWPDDSPPPAPQGKPLKKLRDVV